MEHGITGRIKEISKAVVKQVINTLRMAFMAILVVAAILALNYWFEDPLKRAVFLLGGASVILYVIIKILAVKSFVAGHIVHFLFADAKMQRGIRQVLVLSGSRCCS